ncbi:hypothetical protein EUTSA_v10003471mg [Eutrema salsugineum]|uniref:Uncharacterized protein n=1 Tax=Eutrema salsugineum TaxID=72664 RepID=V4NEM3_EUTSA|nr:hypothetical protein EUTSA_v10003471mg [Eutrema salsugineum]
MCTLRPVSRKTADREKEAVVHNFFTRSNSPTKGRRSFTRASTIKDSKPDVKSPDVKNQIRPNLRPILHLPVNYYFSDQSRLICLLRRQQKTPRDLLLFLTSATMAKNIGCLRFSISQSSPRKLLHHRTQEISCSF